MARAQYAPGSAVAVVSGNLALLVDLPIEHPLVLELFNCIRADPTLDVVLELLVEHGLRDLGSFAAAALVPAGVRVVVRGGYAASASPAAEPLRASGVWVDRFIDRASGVALTTGADVAKPSLPLGSGVVLADTVELGVLSTRAVSAPPAQEATVPVPHAAPAPPAVPAPPVPPVASTPAAAAAVPGAPSAVTAELVGLALLADEPPIGFAPPRWGALLLPNGDRLPLAGTVVLGRNPRVPTGHTGEPPGLVRLEDPEKDVSAQHLEIGLDRGHVLVTDLGSTNGTQVVLPGHAPVQLLPYQPIEIQPGTRIILARVMELVFERA